MSTKIYVNGCATCGRVATQIAKVKKFIPNAEIINSKYSNDALTEHIAHLNDSGIGTRQYHNIVAEDGRVVLLSEWSPLG
jgi:hypothetical protein